MKKLVIDGLEVELTRKKIKRINLRIKADGRVQMSAPLLTPEFEIVRFVRTKRDWIEKNVAKARAREAARPAPLSPIDKERRRAALAARIAERMPAIEQRTGLHSAGWSIRDMHTRWGSCNTATHHINFSLMLADRKDDELDYVIIHELVHTVVPNHGPDFKAYMDKLCPNWRDIRKQMNHSS